MIRPSLWLIVAWSSCPQNMGLPRGQTAHLFGTQSVLNCSSRKVLQTTDQPVCACVLPGKVH